MLWGRGFGVDDFCDMIFIIVFIANFMIFSSNAYLRIILCDKTCVIMLLNLLFEECLHEFSSDFMLSGLHI